MMPMPICASGCLSMALYIFIAATNAVALATDHPSVKSALSPEGAERDVSGPQALGVLVSAEAAKWRRLITDVALD